jgi:hypothetical protein
LTAASGSRPGTALAGIADAGAPGAICAKDRCGVPKTPMINI